MSMHATAAQRLPGSGGGCGRRAKSSLLLRGQSDFLTDRYSERKERRQKGRLLSQEEKEGLQNSATLGSTVS